GPEVLVHSVPSRSASTSSIAPCHSRLSFIAFGRTPAWRLDRASTRREGDRRSPQNLYRRPASRNAGWTQEGRLAAVFVSSFSGGQSSFAPAELRRVRCSRRA